MSPSTPSSTPSLQIELDHDSNEEVVRKMTGRRIFNVQYLFEQMKAVDHSPFNCSFKDMDFVKESRIGFQSTFLFKCKMCGKKEAFNNEKLESKINKNVVQAVVCSGSGFSQLDELCAHLDMPCIAEKTFGKENLLLGDVLKDISLKSMFEAGLEEKQMAIEKGNVDADGVPYITVVADASWGKRSYRTSNYNSLSGVACIIGYETKKVLFLGIRNSYCSVCAVASNKKIEVKKHKCFKNWSGSSTAMEADGVVEGFKCSINMHGLKYTKLIGDGDSSVMSALNEALPYGHSTAIHKIECSNHLLRNYCTKLRNLTKKTENKQGPVPIIMRKCLNDNILRLRKAIKGAIDFSSKMEGKTFTEKVNELKKDLRNGPCHVFGEHANCKTYFCNGPKPGEENFIGQMKDCGLWYDIYTAISPILNNAESLLMGQTNNIVEQFNALIAKFIGGKRINYSLRGSYESRCYAAATKRNTGSLVATMSKVLTKNEELGTYTQKYEKRQAEKAKRKSSQDKKSKRRKRIAGPDEHYGDIEKEPDMEVEHYEKRKQALLADFSKSKIELENIQKDTVGQATNPEWIKQRKIRLTASVFGQICKRRAATSCKNIIKTLLYSNFKGSDATRYGNENEPIALKETEAALGVQVSPCGLYILEEHQYLGASPDGVIDEETIVEIKCPASAANMTPTEAILKKKITFCVLDESDPQKIKLKQNHNYFYQVQGQLNITKKRYCIFVVWTPKGILFEKIEKDTGFWESILNKLRKFYMECILPEIIDPRLPRKLPIRESS